MKKALYILAAASLVLTACAKEEFEHPSELNAPKTASEYTPVVSVDQELNQVTFSVSETGVIPVWVFQNSAGEWAEYHARNGFKKIYTTAGDYAVRLYIMNSSGVTPDYVEKTFHIDNTIMNFDKYIRQISGGSEKVWRIDNSVAAHHACGESVGNPTGWWAAKPDEKAAFGIYDNRLTFSSAGDYTFDPGESGTVYVNTGVNVAPYGAFQESSDYTVSVSKETTPYSFGVEGSDLVLKLQNGALFPYIPNNDYVNDSKFYVISLDNSSMTLVWYTATGNNGGPIAWQFILTSKEPGTEPESTEDPQQPGGYTYGENLIGDLYIDSTWFSPGDWSGGLNPNASFENGKLTLTVPDGVGGSEWQGQVKLVANVPADPEKKYSFSCRIESSTDGTCTVKVADATADAEHAFFYDPNVGLTAYEALSYKNEPVVPDRAYESVMVIFDFGRMAAGTEITATDIKLCEITGESSGGQGGYTYGDELLGGLYVHSTWFSPADWSGGLDPQLVFEGGKATLTVPAVGGSEWQGQVKLVADIPADPEKQYSFACNVESSTDGTCTIKLADAAADAEHAFFYDPNVGLTAYDVIAYKNEPVVPDQAYESVMVIFDFGRLAPGTEITITGISLKEITGESSGGNGGGGNYGDSILGGLYVHSTWFSPADWSGGLDPQLSFEGGKVTLTVPAVGGSEWQGQVKLVADVPADPELAYEFTCKIESSEDGTCTIKVADAAADAEHAFFYDPNVALTAYDVISYRNEPVSPDRAYDAVMVIYDFGRMAPGTEITISDIALRPQK
ncbi:MAG: hypothetical protein IK031_02680 [Bacteroidales bacterium]|nr:hypothetical protein [Bacteroidales bacterium]